VQPAKKNSNAAFRFLSKFIIPHTLTLKERFSRLHSDSAVRRSCLLRACNRESPNYSILHKYKSFLGWHPRHGHPLHGLLPGPQKIPPFLWAGRRGFVPQLALCSAHGYRPWWVSHRCGRAAPESCGMSAPCSRRCVANEWRMVWQVAGLLIPAACTAAGTARYTRLGSRWCRPSMFSRGSRQRRP
jgi:hypothetical protein